MQEEKMDRVREYLLKSEKKKRKEKKRKEKTVNKEERREEDWRSDVLRMIAFRAYNPHYFIGASP